VRRLGGCISGGTERDKRGAGLYAGDIKADVARRGVEGVIHDAQNFCFHQIEDLIIRRHVGLPVLTLEADRPGRVDAGMRLRVESLIEMLRQARHRVA
jgi:benzoyl-CoA reductase/2-hydroxyglutaryl-CoA dehydratase subunit BcrC/BadD/HgdB